MGRRQRIVDLCGLPGGISVCGWPERRVRVRKRGRERRDGGSLVVAGNISNEVFRIGFPFEIEPGTKAYACLPDVENKQAITSHGKYSPRPDVLQSA